MRRFVPISLILCVILVMGAAVRDDSKAPAPVDPSEVADPYVSRRTALVNASEIAESAVVAVGTIESHFRGYPMGNRLYVDPNPTMEPFPYLGSGVIIDGERVRLVPGLFEDTVPQHVAAPVAFAHVDCDWYDPVRLCLATLDRHLSPGGLLIVDDYSDYEGCRRAVDGFLAAHPDFEIVSPAPNALIRRRSSG